MKKANDIMQEKENWVAETAQIIEKRIFELFEKKVEENELEYWENQFIPIQYSSIEDIEQKVFEEREQKNFKKKCPNTEKKILEIVFSSLKKQLAEYGFKFGFNNVSEIFGIGALEAEMKVLNEKIYFDEGGKIGKLTVKQQENGGLSIEQ